MCYFHTFWAGIVFGHGAILLQTGCILTLIRLLFISWVVKLHFHWCKLWLLFLPRVVKLFFEKRKKLHQNFGVNLRCQKIQYFLVSFYSGVSLLEFLRRSKNSPENIGFFGTVDLLQSSGVIFFQCSCQSATDILQAANLLMVFSGLHW